MASGSEAKFQMPPLVKSAASGAIFVMELAISGRSGRSHHANAVG